MQPLRSTVFENRKLATAIDGCKLLAAGIWTEIKNGFAHRDGSFCVFVGLSLSWGQQGRRQDDASNNFVHGVILATSLAAFPRPRKAPEAPGEYAKTSQNETVDLVN